MAGEQLCEKGLGLLADSGLEHESASCCVWWGWLGACPAVSVGATWPRDYRPSLSAHQSTAGILHPIFGRAVQEGHE